MKEVTNLTRMSKAYDLDSYDDNGRRRAIHLAPRESIKLKDDDVRSLQLMAAEGRGEISIADTKKTAASSSESEDDDKKSDSSKKSDKKKSSKPKE